MRRRSVSHSPLLLNCIYASALILIRLLKNGRENLHKISNVSSTNTKDWYQEHGMNAQQDVVQNSLEVVSEARTALVEYGQQEYYDEE